MLVKILSDLHLEATPDYRPNQYPLDKDTILALAGDICEIERTAYITEFLSDMSNQFKHVLYVAGNHEYYGGHINYSAEKLEDIVSKYDNVHFLNNKSIIIDGVKFIGTTLWTNVDKGDPLSRYTLEKGMNDYRKIRVRDYQKLRTGDTIQLFNENIRFLKSELTDYNGKSMIITHHAPSFLSIHDDYIGNVFNCGYVSDLSGLIEEYSPTAMAHGHVHNSFDYKLYNTRIVCNPKGYPRSVAMIDEELVRRYENSLYDDNFTILL